MDKGVLLDRLGATGRGPDVVGKGLGPDAAGPEPEYSRSDRLSLSTAADSHPGAAAIWPGAAETEYVFLGGYPEAERRLDTVSAGLDGDGNGGE